MVCFVRQCKGELKHRELRFSFLAKTAALISPSIYNTGKLCYYKFSNKLNHSFTFRRNNQYVNTSRSRCKLLKRVRNSENFKREVQKLKKTQILRPTFTGVNSASGRKLYDF